MTLNTDTTSVFHPHPLARLKPGDILWTWCSRSMDREDHLYQPGQTPPLICLHCFPEAKPQPEQ